MKDYLENVIESLRKELTRIKKNHSRHKLSNEENITDALEDCLCALKDVDQLTTYDDHKTKYIMRKIAPVLTQLTLHYSIEYDENHLNT